MKKILIILLTALCAIACNAEPKSREAEKAAADHGKVLVVYFSRSGIF